MCAAEGSLLLQPVRAALLTCLATPAALDAVATPPGVLPLRVAADEMLLVAAADRQAAALAAAQAALARLDVAALAIDVTDAYAVWSLTQPLARPALARLSSMPPPHPGAAAWFAQGAVAGVAAKVVALPDRNLIFVSSTLAHHLRDRVLQLCADLRPQLLPEWPFAVPLGDVAAGTSR